MAWYRQQMARRQAMLAAARTFGIGRNIQAPGAGSVVQDAPKDEGPKDEGPKDEGPKDEGPKDEGPKDEGPKDEGPKDEGPKDEGLDNQQQAVTD